MSWLNSLIQRLPGSWQIANGHGFALGVIAAASLPACNHSRQHEKRAIPGAAGVADREVVCDWNGSAYAWGEVGLAALDTRFLTPAEGNAAYLIPAGVIAAYGGAAAPTGWLLCDGSAISRATFAALFAAIGTGFGAGNGSTTFNVPNARGRMPRGLDAANAQCDALGEAGGAQDVTLTAVQSGLPAHSHGAGTLATSDPGTHTHSYPWASAAGGFAGLTAPGNNNSGTVLTTGAGAHTHTINGSVANNTTAAAAQAHTNMPPFLTIQFIIKT